MNAVHDSLHRDGGSTDDAGIGLAAGALGSLPLVGPALVAGCASCAGLGAAAGLGAVGALPPAWWILGFAAVALGVVAVERHRARRCSRRPAFARSLLVLGATAVASWLATRFLVVPALQWLTGPAAPPTDGPILP